MNEETETKVSPTRPAWQRFLPLVVLLGLLAVVFANGWHEQLSINTLRDNQEALQTWVAENLLLAVLAYLVFYALAVSISVPGALWFTIGAGFLFGTLIGTGVAVIGATIGATIIFLAARFAFADWVRSRFGKYVEKLQDGFSQDAFTYVVILRLIPALPFFGINIATALLNVPIRAYFFGTLIGVIPGAYVYATLGSKISELTAAGEVPGFADLLTLDVIGAMIAFALLAILPWVYKRITGKKAPADEVVTDDA